MQACDLTEAEGHVTLAKHGALLIVPMPAPGVWRLIAQVRPRAQLGDAAAWAALVASRAGLDLGISRLGWTSQFDLTSGVANRFRKGRIFLLGDAAHVHSPVGGQGLNTGVQDAHNLVWKLALALQGRLESSQAEALLDSYDTERRRIARRMVRATSRATRVLTVTNPVVRWVRGGIVRLVLGRSCIKDRLARGVGMLDLKTAGQSRLPNPEILAGGRLHDLVDALKPTRLRWQGHDIMVRPDRIVARPGSIPQAAFVTVQESPRVSCV